MSSPLISVIGLGLTVCMSQSSCTAIINGKPEWLITRNVRSDTDSLKAQSTISNAPQFFFIATEQRNFRNVIPLRVGETSGIVLWPKPSLANWCFPARLPTHWPVSEPAVTYTAIHHDKRPRSVTMTFPFMHSIYAFTHCLLIVNIRDRRLRKSLK